MEEKKKEVKLEKVVTSPVLIKKKGKASQLFHSFFVEDFKSVASYVGEQILLPAMKKVFVDIINSAANSFVNGIGNYVSGKKTTSSNMFISYEPFYKTKESRPASNPVTATSALYNSRRMVYDFGEVSVNSREEAERIVAIMREALDVYQSVSVANLYQLADVIPNQIDFDWGWTNLDNIQIINTYDDRFTIRFPKVKSLKELGR